MKTRRHSSFQSGGKLVTVISLASTSLLSSWVCFLTFPVGSDHPGAADETLLRSLYSELDVPFLALLGWPPDDG